MSGGYRKYLRNVIPRMAKHDDVEAILCAAPATVNVKDWFDINSTVAVEFVNCQPFRFLHQSLDPQLRRHLEKFSPDVLFIPMERYFRFNDVPLVNMIRNMEPLICPNGGNSISEILRNWLRAKNAQKAVNKADRIIAVSEFVKNFLINRWGIPSDKIGMVYHGIDLPKGNVGIRPSSIPKNWDGRFLFTAGSIRPARGLEDVLSTMEYMMSYNTEMPGIVIAGESSANMIVYQRELQDWLKKRNLSSKICWVGDLNEEEMAWCYQNCQIFVMTSRVESFGQVALEAMSHGCICISADNPCLPEIFGDGAIYYEPKDGKALADAIQHVLAWDDNQRKVASERARMRAAKFSWDVCAKKTVEVLAKAAESRQSGKL